MRNHLVTFLFIAFFMVNCGDDDTAPADTGNTADVSGDVAGDTTSPDVTGDLAGDPPGFRTIVVSITGELPSEDDFTDEDATRIIPTTLSSEFRIFAEDDSTSVDELTVEVIDGDASSFETVEQTASYRNGLWFIETDLSPDMEMRVRLQDGDGHVTISTYALIIPPLDEAIVGDWERPFFDTDQVILNTTDLSLEDDGTWTEQQGGSGMDRTGTYDFDDDGNIELEVRTTENSLDGTDDTNSDTIEAVYVGPYYVDELYLGLFPFTRADGQSDLESTWTRQILNYEPDGDDLELVEDRTETLVINADETWAETWTGTEYDGSDETAINRSWGGTWEIEINENYTESVGDFLARTVTTVDGAAADEPYLVWYELHITRVGNLLISPRVRESN